MEKISINGKLVSENEGAICLKSPSIRYGIMVFDATNIYYCGENQSCKIFRLREHIERLLYSCARIGLRLKFSEDEIVKFAIDLIKSRRTFTDAGLRFFVYYNKEESFTTNTLANLAIYILDLTKVKMSDNIKLSISDYQKSENGMLPAQIKSTAHYAYSRIAVIKAQRTGFDDVIFLNQNGYITESSRSNIFIIKNGCVLTPPVSTGILDGITRRSIIELCEHLQIPIIQQNMTRYDLYSSDCVFLTGSTSGITYVSKIDDITFSNEHALEILNMIKRAYTESCRGELKKEWITQIQLN